MKISCFFFTYAGFFIFFLGKHILVHAEVEYYVVKPATPIRLPPYQYQSRFGFLNKYKRPISSKPPFQSDTVFQIQPSDAISEQKYSQPDLTYPREKSDLGIKVPFVNTNAHQTHLAPSTSLGKTSFSTHNLHHPEKNPLKPARDIRYLDSSLDVYDDFSQDQPVKNIRHILEIHDLNENFSSVQSQMLDNLTDSSSTLISVSSENILSYENPPADFNSNFSSMSVKQNAKVSKNVSNTVILDINSTLSVTTDLITITEPPVYIDFFNQTNLKDNLSVSGYPEVFDDGNITNSLQSSDFGRKISSGAVAGIVIAVLISVTLVSSAVIYLLYRKFNGKCTGVVDSKFNTDSCGYLDDSLRSSIYLNNHIELPKESSEEMTSLDNDSFLNSLETMTIQNYWADNSKNTKV